MAWSAIPGPAISAATAARPMPKMRRRSARPASSPMASRRNRSAAMAAAAATAAAWSRSAARAAAPAPAARPSIKLDSTSDITTTGDYAHGAFAQSIGGGGGSTGWTGSLTASLGGDAGSGAIGGDVSVTADDGAHIHTSGLGAYGIFAELVGGSGGTASGSGGIFALGGAGGTGNNGGNVTVTSGATILTEGQDARGVMAQSVGGGGGNANSSGGLVSLRRLGHGGRQRRRGLGHPDLGQRHHHLWRRRRWRVRRNRSAAAAVRAARRAALRRSAAKLERAAPAATSALSNAGTIHTGLLDDNGTITGDYAHGIFAQSIGGGGGSGGGGGGLVAIGGSGSVASTGGTVTIGNSGSIYTIGNMASAMQAQSIGGGGGNGGSSGALLLSIGGDGAAGSDGGLVTANMSGYLSTTGDDSHGMFVQSVGGGGGNGGSATSISLFAGVALGGTGDSRRQGRQCRRQPEPADDPGERRRHLGRSLYFDHRRQVARHLCAVGRRRRRVGRLCRPGLGRRVRRGQHRHWRRWRRRRRWRHRRCRRQRLHSDHWRLFRRLVRAKRRRRRRRRRRFGRGSFVGRRRLQRLLCPEPGRNRRGRRHWRHRRCRFRAAASSPRAIIRPASSRSRSAAAAARAASASASRRRRAMAWR